MKHLARNEEIDTARLPYIHKQLDQLKPKFEAENKNLSAEDKAAAWDKVCIEAIKEIQTSYANQITSVQQERAGLLDLHKSGLPDAAKSAAEIMADAKY